MPQMRMYIASTFLLAACTAEHAPPAPADVNGEPATEVTASPAQRGGLLCSRERDPQGLFCDQETPRLTAAEAVALARAAVPEGRFYYLMSGNLGSLNVDGRDERWLILFHDDAGMETTSVAIEQGKIANVTRAADGQAIECDATSDMQVLDSEAVVHDALERLAPELGKFVHGHGSLFLRQQACPYRLDDEELDYVTVLQSPGAEQTADAARFYHLRYGQDSRFVEERDACTSVDFDACARN